MKRLFFLTLSFSLFVLIAASCSSKRVARLETSIVTDLSGKWNDTDSRLVSENMINDVLSRPWIGEFRASASRKPRVIVGTVINKSHEHIAIQTFTNDLERALLNSGKVSFVATAQERTELRAERADQTEQAGPAGRQLKGEKAADFMLKGSINSILDELQGTKVVFYQIDLSLIQIDTNEVVWIGQKKIKKIIDRDSLKW